MFKLPLYVIYPIYTMILGLIMLAIVPKEKIKALAFSAILFGAIGNIFVILISSTLNIAKHINYEPFGALGLSFFPPIAWTAFFILYLHFLPEKKPWIYIFVLSSALYSTFFANILINLGVFASYYGRFIVPFIIYLI